MKINYHENAFTGLEAAIVLIAFVVVAAVFSYVVLGAGFFTTQKTQETVYQAVGQSTSNMLIKGNVYGFASAVNGNITSVNITLGVAPGAPSQDLTKLKVVYSSANIAPVTMTYTTGVATAALFSSPATSIAGDDQVTIAIYIPPSGGSPNSDINLELRPAGGGAAIPITKTVPAYTALVNILR
jgi:flagellin FlaB